MSSEETPEQGTLDLTERGDYDDDEVSWDDRGGHSTPIDADVDYTLSGNVARDLIKYVRSNTIKNEQQFLVTALGYLTGYFTEIDHYVSGVLIGTSSSGKTHVQSKIEDLFHRDHMYQATTGSDKSLIYDGEWDEAHIASLDELQKPSDTLIEFLKSVHADDESFEYKLTPDSAEKREAEEVQTIVRTAKPYWFLFAQTDSDFEMWNRLLKVPVHESGSKNEAVGAIAHDHYYVQIGDSDVEYGYDFDDGTMALQSHIASIPTAIEHGFIPGRVFIPNGDPDAFDRSGPECDRSGGFEWDSYDILNPIYNHGRSESNRVYDMVTNLIRASALLNYKNRDVVHLDVPNHEVGEYIIAEPQDVTNVLACREALLATTHELDDKKRTICAAIENNTGNQNEADMGTIVEGLQETDMSMLSRPELRANLEKLHENYLVDINQNASESGQQDTYTFNGWGELGFARVFEHEGLFEDCYDPVSGDPFVSMHEELRDDLQDTASDLMSDSDADISSGGGQKTLGGGSTRSIDLDDHVETIREQMHDSIDGVRVNDVNDVPVEALIGLTDPLDPDKVIDTQNTVLDPNHSIWFQHDKPDDWVTTEQDARREVKSAIRELMDKRVATQSTVHERNEDGSAKDVTFSVLGKSDV